MQMSRNGPDMTFVTKNTKKIAGANANEQVWPRFEICVKIYTSMFSINEFAKAQKMHKLRVLPRFEKVWAG